LAHYAPQTIAVTVFSKGAVNKNKPNTRNHILLARLIATTPLNSYKFAQSLINISSKIASPNSSNLSDSSTTLPTFSSTNQTTYKNNDTMETTHRKIELQSPLDLLYLHANASSLLRSKLDLHFPPSAAPASASDDVLKSRVEELSSAWLDKVYADVKANLSINGLEGKQMEEAMVMAEGKGEGELNRC
jgi:hypothetical protein